MTRYTLGLLFILLATPGYGLAQESPPRPNPHGSDWENTVRLDDPKNADRNSIWQQQRPGESPNPELWYRMRVKQDLLALNRTCRELVKQTEGPGQADGRAIVRGAARTAELSRSLWSNLQHGKSNRTKPESQVREAVDPGGDPLDGIRTLKRLINEVTEAVADEERTHTLDVNRRSEILDKLEAINRLALVVAKSTGR